MDLAIYYFMQDKGTFNILITVNPLYTILVTLTEMLFLHCVTFHQGIHCFF